MLGAFLLSEGVFERDVDAEAAAWEVLGDDGEIGIWIDY